ncbi:MAG: hypothetical protein NZ602_00950 [Thermoguttaceae bacterium]|nr:hypothetical protein [Thermoguttaceae bacterium]MDW8036500.1 hypothetical protein [Thermoguttaceae bacterium]
MFSISEPFWLHENTRRRVCVALFVLGCILPTVGLCVWAGWRMTPWYLEQQAAEAERLLGLIVKVQGLRHPRPGEVIYEGIQLADPKTAELILGAEQVEIHWRRPTAPNRACSRRVEVCFRGLEIYTEGLGQLVELVRRALAQPPNWPRCELQVQAAEARLRSGQQIRTLTDLTGFLQPLEQGSQGSFSFRLVGSQASQPIQIRFGQDHTHKPPVSGLELSLGQSSIACCMLAGVLPGLERLGPLASMRGTLWIYQQQGQVEYRFQGDLFQVDLNMLLGQELERMLSGLAQIEVEDARLVNGRLEEVVAVVRAGPGTISRRLWQSAVQEWGLSTSLLPEPDEQVFSYEQLGAMVRISSEGLQLRGICSVPAPGCILVNSHQLLLGEGKQINAPIPIPALVRVLASRQPDQQALWVPATQQAQELLQILPLPTETAASDHTVGLADSGAKTRLE